MVTLPAYVPDAGHIVRLTFDPQAGREQAGRRPAVVLSRAAYNGRVGLAVVCPITSQIKGFPFEVELPSGLKVYGVVLSDHVKSVDWRARQAEFLHTMPADVMDDVRAKLAPLLGIE